MIGSKNNFYGKKHSERTRIKISKIQGGSGKLYSKCRICRKRFKADNPARIRIGRGKYCSRLCHGKAISKIIGKNHQNWKGDKIGYYGLHNWVRKHLGIPRFCEHCGNRKLRHRQYHWANKSRKYLRKLSDWIRLCAKCHSKYDRL